MVSWTSVVEETIAVACTFWNDLEMYALLGYTEKGTVCNYSALDFLRRVSKDFGECNWTEEKGETTAEWDACYCPYKSCTQQLKQFLFLSRSCWRGPVYVLQGYELHEHQLEANRASLVVC